MLGIKGQLCCEVVDLFGLSSQDCGDIVPLLALSKSR